MWEDHSLADWSDDDFRIFCGDLGNDVNDELLTRTFNKYASFIKAKVIRDKRTGKSKGFGFISFKDPSDFSKALKEMDGKSCLRVYVCVFGAVPGSVGLVYLCGDKTIHFAMLKHSRFFR